MSAMVKSWISCIVMVVVVFGLTASTQATPSAWSDDFDLYGNGTGIIGQGAWVGWAQVGTADALVTNAQANSVPHSLAMGGATEIDVVPQFSGVTSGIQTLDVMTYVPASSIGGAGFTDIGLMSRHEGFQGATDTQWFTAFGFGMGNGLANGNAETPLITDQWIPAQVVFDIDNRTYDKYYNGALSHSGSWGGDFAIVGFDVYSPPGAAPMFLDDFNMTPEPATMALLLAGGLGLVRRRKRA